MGNERTNEQDADTRDPHPLHDRLPDFDGDLEAARRLRAEGRSTLDHQLDALDDIDSKASSILRVNMLLLGLILTALSLAAEDGIISLGELSNGYTFVGIIFLLLSTAFAALTYTASDTEVGIDSKTMRNALEADLTSREVEVGMAEGYAYWIDFNARTNTLNTVLITLTSWFIVISLANFSLGIYAAVGTLSVWPFAIVTWILLGIWAALSNLLAQLRKAMEELTLSDLRLVP